MFSIKAAWNKAAWYPRIYVETIITHQNVMPHMMRPKYKDGFLDNWRIDGNDQQQNFRKDKTKQE